MKSSCMGSDGGSFFRLVGFFLGSRSLGPHGECILGGYLLWQTAACGFGPFGRPWARFFIVKVAEIALGRSFACSLRRAGRRTISRGSASNDPSAAA